VIIGDIHLYVDDGMIFMCQTNDDGDEDDFIMIKPEQMPHVIEWVQKTAESLEEIKKEKEMLRNSKNVI
jgi:hypothetical protein